MLCRRVDVLPVEVIVRGYLAGSGWKDYERGGSIGGIRLPDGLREGDRLPEPILTPSTKADLGRHDETIDFETLGEKDAALLDTVTLRHRDSMKQERVKISDLAENLLASIR